MLDLIIIGAGPYGLAAAAQARQAGLDYLLIGEPMKFWKSTMPHFMVLRSPFVASSIYNPEPGFQLEDYFRETGRTSNKREKLSLKIYLRYLDWYLAKAALNILPQTVESLTRAASGAFTAITRDGQQIQARTAIVAVGNLPFTAIPDQFSAVNKQFYSHTSEVIDFAPFAGKKVLVVGAGQSAIEACQGLLQVDAQVELMHRQKALYWHNIPLRINVPLLLFFISFPTVLEIVPYALRKAVGDQVSKPTVDTSLRPVIEGKIKEYQLASLQRVSQTGNGVTVAFADGRETTVDHVILGTGYTVDIGRLALLAQSLRTQVKVLDGYPQINRHLESSVPGLFFTGVTAKGRFGPTFNFIFASPSSGRRVIEGVQKRLKLI